MEQSYALPMKPGINLAGSLFTATDAAVRE